MKQDLQQQSNRRSKFDARGYIRVSQGFTIVELLMAIAVIAVLAVMAIVGYNGIARRANDSAFALELSQWKKTAQLYRVDNGIDDCPDNYSFVYGNESLGTMPGFCVMKYEAKNVGGVATSQAAGIPWNMVTLYDAATQSTNVGGHLLTEAEWMTIAADIVSVGYNWSDGMVNSGIVYQGHVGGNPASALAASGDDADVLSGMTGGFGESSGNNSSRVLYLSSGDAIWDFSGNVYEWTQQTMGVSELAMSNVGVGGDITWYWRDYTDGSLSLGNLAIVSRPMTLNSWTNPVRGVDLSDIEWSTNRGVGQIYAYYADTAWRGFARGGYWSGGTSSGVLSLYLRFIAGVAYSPVGFRVAR